MWVAAHGVMIVTPVHWYQATAPLKLVTDRLVCADGGNPDPTSTQGKDAAKAKKLELDGWGYPEHLQGRLFAAVVHGAAEGAGAVRRNIDMVRAGLKAELDRYIGYYKAMRDEPCRAGGGRSHPGGGAQRGANARRGGKGAARQPPHIAWP